MTGYRAEEVLGRTPRMLQGPGTDRTATARLRSALERSEPIQIELLNYKKDGPPIWVEISVVPVLDEQGRLAHWTAVMRDTTERRRAEESALRLAREEAARTLAQEAERKITAILESITDAFFALDGEGQGSGSPSSKALSIHMADASGPRARSASERRSTSRYRRLTSPKP